MGDTDVIRKHIEIVDGFDGPKAVVAGHRIRVEDVVTWHERMRMSPYEIVHHYPTLSLADVYAALAYYWDNRDDIEIAMAQGKAFVEEFRRQHPDVTELKADDRRSA